MRYVHLGLVIIIFGLLTCGITLIQEHEALSAILICTSLVLSVMGIIILKIEEINNKIK